MAIAGLFLLSYIRELWVMQTQPDRYDDLPKPKFHYDEIGIREMSRKHRLILGYPAFILVPGMIGWLLVASSS